MLFANQELAIMCFEKNLRAANRESDHVLARFANAGLREKTFLWQSVAVKLL